METWEYDDIIFDSVIRRSGGSLVITIPPELIRRFLLKEGQQVRLIGVVRKGLDLEGGILIYFGRFEIEEEADKYIVTLNSDMEITKALINKLGEILEKYHLNNYYINKVDGKKMKIEIILSKIGVDGIVNITEEDIKKIFKEFETLGLKITNIEVEKEKLNWKGMDPSFLIRYARELPKDLKIKWIYR